MLVQFVFAIIFGVVLHFTILELLSRTIKKPKKIESNVVQTLVDVNSNTSEEVDKAKRILYKIGYTEEQIEEIINS